MEGDNRGPSMKRARITDFDSRKTSGYSEYPTKRKPDTYQCNRCEFGSDEFVDYIAHKNAHMKREYDALATSACYKICLTGIPTKSRIQSLGSSSKDVKYINLNSDLSCTSCINMSGATLAIPRLSELSKQNQVYIQKTSPVPLEEKPNVMRFFTTQPVFAVYIKDKSTIIANDRRVKAIQECPLAIDCPVKPVNTLEWLDKILDTRKKDRDTNN